MLLLENIFDRDFKNSFIDEVFRMPVTGNGWGNVNRMHSDIQELEGSYLIDMELPGFEKQDVQAELKDGYLIVNASRNENKEEQDDSGKYIRKERYHGSYQRSFYVGDHLEIEDIKANFKNGILTMEVPKKEALPKVETKKYISIEG